MDLLTREQIRKAGSLLVEAGRAPTRRESGPKLQFARLVSDLAADENCYGEDLEACRDYARQHGLAFERHRPLIPFSALVSTETRDVTSATSGAGGGYLIQSDVQAAVDILRPWSVTARAGIEIETGLVGNQTVPKTSAKSTGYWLSTEATQITASQPTLVQLALTPKTVGDVITFSRQLSKQANAEALVRRELLRTIGTALDQAVIAGTGGVQPLGLITTTGINTTSGTSLGQAAVSEMKRKVAEANADDAGIAFLSTPAIRELLEKRERATGSGFVWDDDRVASRPAYASTDVPTATMIAASWPMIYLGIWGDGFTLEVNPCDPTGFKAGTIQARMILHVDIAVRHPAAVCVASSIT